MSDTGAWWRVFACLALTALLDACVATPQTDAIQASSSGLPTTALLTDVPFYPQEDYQCGPAALATVLQDAAVDVQPEELVSQVYIPARQGSLQIEMLAATRRYGRIPYVLPQRLDVLLAQVSAGLPVLVMQNLGLKRLPQWHYAVVVGYDLENGSITLRSGTIRDYTISLKVFERTWQRAEHWAVVSLTPGDMPVSVRESDYFEAVAVFESVQPSMSGPAWQAAYQRWPRGRLSAMGLSNHLYQQGALDGAADILENLLRHDPGYAPARQNLATIRQQMDSGVVP